MTLKTILLFSSLMTLSVISCSTDKSTELENKPVKLKTSNKHLQSNFERCIIMTEQLMKTQFNNKEFSKHFNLSKRTTGFEYENVIYNMSDTLYELPKNYQIFYDFIYEGDTLSTFRADFDANLKIVDYSKFHLIAFRKFIDKELTITEPIATEIALKNGMKRKDLELIFRCSAKEYYWECQNNCNGCLSFHIDAKTGSIIKQGKVVYRY